MIEKLIAKQRELGETDGAFAARLGIPRITWLFYRSGRIKSLTPRLARAAKKAFAEMDEEATLFLLYGVQRQTEAVTPQTEGVT